MLTDGLVICVNHQLMLVCNDCIKCVFILVFCYLTTTTIGDYKPFNSRLELYHHTLHCVLLTCGMIKTTCACEQTTLCYNLLDFITNYYKGDIYVYTYVVVVFTNL